MTGSNFQVIAAHRPVLGAVRHEVESQASAEMVAAGCEFMDSAPENFRTMWRSASTEAQD